MGPLISKLSGPVAPVIGLTKSTVTPPPPLAASVWENPSNRQKQVVRGPSGLLISWYTAAVAGWVRALTCPPALLCSEGP